MMHTPLILLILLISLVFSCEQDGVEEQDQSKSNGISDAMVKDDAYVCLAYPCACCGCQGNEQAITPLDSNGCPTCPICVPIEEVMDLGTN